MIHAITTLLEALDEVCRIERRVLRGLLQREFDLMLNNTHPTAYDLRFQPEGAASWALRFPDYRGGAELHAAHRHKWEHVYHAAMIYPHTVAELSLDELIAAHGPLLPAYR